MNMNRVNEVLAAMKSFGKEKYQKGELLSEMFALQDDIVRLTFNEDHATAGNLKIWDVERHLVQLNQECGNVADEQIQMFCDGSKTLCNMIKAEISGNRGEAKAFRTLEYIRTPKVILKNVELNDENERTELDAVIITPQMVTIIEVKNTSKNIFIDEVGDYYLTGEFLRWDCNIGNKMRLKEGLLRKVLKEGGFDDIQIRSLVVFTNNKIEVHNKYDQVKTCFVSQINHIIENSWSNRVLSENEMNQMESVIKDAANTEAYFVGFNVEKYKKDFAVAISTLEEASKAREHKEGGIYSIWNWLKNLFNKNRVGYVA